MINKIKMVQRLGGKANFTQPKSPTRPTSFSARQSVNANRKFVGNYSRSDLRSRPASATLGSTNSAKPDNSTNSAKSTTSAPQPSSSNSPRDLSVTDSRATDSIRPNFIPSWLRKK